MHITVQRAGLARALAAVSRVVERRNTIPILACVHLSADGDMLTVRATDLDMEMSVKTPADVAMPGCTAVDAVRLGDIVKRLSGDSVVLQVDGDALVVKSGRSRSKLATVDANDYPTLNAGEFTAEFEIDLAALVAPVAYAQSDEDTRYYLKGVYLHETAEGLAAVATDGHKLAKRQTDVSVAVPESIIPKKAIAALPKGPATVSLSPRTIRVVAGDVDLTSKLIDGTFPDYARVVPQGNDKSVRVDKVRLAKAAELAMTVQDTMSKSVRLDIAPGAVTVTARGAGGEAGEDIEAAYSGEPFSICINGAYLVETLAAFGTAEVEMRFADPGSPILFTAGGDLTAVAMPMRI